MTLPKFAGGRLTAAVIADYIDSHRLESMRLRKLGDRYRGKAPIHGRTFNQPNKINNRLGNDFFSEIVDIKVGYMAADVSIDLDESKMEEPAKAERQTSFVHRHMAADGYQDLIVDTLSSAAVYGKAIHKLTTAFREDGTSEVWPHAVLADPSEVILIYDTDHTELLNAVHYYDIEVQATGETMTRIEWYDDRNVTFFLRAKDGGIMFDDSEENNPRPHLYMSVPFVEFANNRQKTGDCDNVLDLIDAYDRTLSDINSEVEQLRLSYMIVKGAHVDRETLELLKQTGVMSLQPEDEVSFLTKQLDDDIIEHHLDRLEKNIVRFSKSIDYSDVEAVAGNMPVIAFKLKAAALEAKSKITERKFVQAIREEFRKLGGHIMYSIRTETPIDTAALRVQFTRNIPMSMKYELEVLSEGRGNVSMKTLYRNMSFIEDPDVELQALIDERDSEVNPYRGDSNLRVV